MKNLVKKIRERKLPKEPQGRITTDTLAEHRERVLAGGRKFKYPVQYARHKLVINAIIIGVVAIIVFVVLGWYMLYPGQNTSDFMYRVTRVVPVPVASVDSSPVRYSDYLMKYRSAAHYLVEKERIDTKTEDGKRQLEFVKTQALNDAIADTYAAKLAKQLNLEVSDSDLEAYLKQQRLSNDGEVSESTYNSVIKDYYGWSPDEYRQTMKSKLLRQMVAYAVDTTAEQRAKEVESKISSGNSDLKAIVEEIKAANKDGKDGGGNKDGKSAADKNVAEYLPAAWVPKTNQDGGLAVVAAQLQKGQISKAVKSTTVTGYNFVKLVDSSADQVQYEYLHIPLAEFTKRLASAEADGKLTKYIAAEDATKS